MIYEWKNVDYRNLGDAMSELILEQLPYETAKEMVESTTEMHFLLGSHITNQLIFEICDMGYKPVFHGCGWRGAELNPALIEKADFYGCRGPLTSAALNRAGRYVDVIGDPAYDLLGDLDIKPEPNGLSYLIPHVLDYESWLYTPEEFFVDEILEAKVWTRADVLDKIKRIASADFVLAGSMHACIIADYYDVPFAPFSGKRIDCPDKWMDWLESRGYPSKHLDFFDDPDAGRRWHDSVIRPRKAQSRRR